MTRPLPPCPQHGTIPNPLCHVQQAAPQVRMFDVERREREDVGMGWDEIAEVIFGAMFLAAVCWISIAAWLGQ